MKKEFVGSIKEIIQQISDFCLGKGISTLKLNHKGYTKDKKAIMEIVYEIVPEGKETTLEKLIFLKKYYGVK